MCDILFCLDTHTQLKMKKSKNKKTSKNKGKAKKSVVLISSGKSKGKNEKTRPKRKKYTEQKIKMAIGALDKGVSLRKAAAAYGVPKATLSRRKNNPNVIFKKPSPPTQLSEDEEKEIVHWMKKRQKLGHGVTKEELLTSVQSYVVSLGKKTKFTHDRPGRHWLEGFVKRHPSISLRKPQKLSDERDAVTKEDLKLWHDEQRVYLTSKDLLNISPNRVFNCDETNVVFSPELEPVFAEKASRLVYTIDDDGKHSRTILFMYNAEGIRAPPMVMFKSRPDAVLRLGESVSEISFSISHQLSPFCDSYV